MTWARLDDQILTNPKIAATGGLGFAMHAAGIVYCSQNNTDGFVPYGVARTLLNLDNVCWVNGYEGRDADCIHIVRVGVPGYESLEGAGLWDWDEERRGWWVHDFLDYNPSRAQVEAERAQRSEKASKAAKARWDANRNASSMQQACDEHDSSSAQSNAQTMLGDAPSRPRPSVVNKSVVNSNSGCPQPGDDDDIWKPSSEDLTWAKDRGLGLQAILDETEKWREANRDTYVPFPERAWRGWIEKAKVEPARPRASSPVPRCEECEAPFVILDDGRSGCPYCPPPAALRIV